MDKKLVSVEMLVDTAYVKPRFKGDVLNVPEDVANRWTKNKIAKYVDGSYKSNNDDEKSSVEDSAMSQYESMNAKELYALCKEKGIEAEAKKPKEYYLEILNEYK